MPYRIAVLSKYPPLEGGIAAKTYWLARGLAARDHVVHVITHESSAGQGYVIGNCDCLVDPIPNLHAHRTPDEVPWHLPEDKEYALSLVDMTLRVIQEHDVQLVDTGYLVPYGIAGHLAKSLTGIPHVLRHGGSDLEKFLKPGILGTLLAETISRADMVITDKGGKDVLAPMTSHISCQPAYIPDAEVFVPGTSPQPRRRLAAIGKMNHHWQHKGLHLVADIMRRLTPDFECWIVGQGNGMMDFRHNLGADLAATLRWQPFVPPWEMPRLLDQFDGVFIFESSLPHPVTSNLALEALCCGIGIVTDRADFVETYQSLVAISKDQVLVVPGTETSVAANMILRWIRERKPLDQPAFPPFSYSQYLSATESVYAEVLAAGAERDSRPAW